MLTHEQKQARSLKGAQERWNPTIPSASHTGILKIHSLGMEIPCAIIKTENGEVLRLLTQTGMLKALGRSRGSHLQNNESGDLPVFIKANNLKPFIDSDLSKVGSEVIFRMKNGKKAIGYRAELLPIICSVYLEAERAGALTLNQKKMAEVCHILQKSFSTIGLISLVDEATGYQKIRESDELQKFLEKFINKELAKWAKRFPSEFYEQIYRLKNWAWNSASKNKYPVVGYYTKDLVYERLAPGILEEMNRIMPLKEDGSRKGCYHQLLTEDVGIPRLKEHFSALIAVMKLSKTWEDLISNVNIVLPKVVEFDEKDELTIEVK